MDLRLFFHQMRHLPFNLRAHKMASAAGRISGRRLFGNTLKQDLEKGNIMKKLQIISLAAVLLCLLAGGAAFGKASTAELYTHALMTGDAGALEKLLAPNFWYIGSNGHIRDKEHFIQEVRDKKFVVEHMALRNVRETSLGETTILTGNGIFDGKFERKTPQGLMRYTLVLANNRGTEQVALFQATPVLPTSECMDGNCKLK